MEIQHFTIKNNTIEIPCILWGKKSNNIIIAVHGTMSNKQDTVIKILAAVACSLGYTVLSFDLPQHGDRQKNTNYICNPQNAISDLQAIYKKAYSLSSNISLFGCSIGAYFSLLAFNSQPYSQNIKKALFLSPVVNMHSIIQKMMQDNNINETQLQQKQIISLPAGQTLYWNYYSYVKSNPLTFKWNSPIQIIFGEDDEVTNKNDLQTFVKRYNANVTYVPNCKHYFYNNYQLKNYTKWLKNNL